jgi:hypothetical protein
VSIFKEAFLQALQEDLINSATTWNTGIGQLHYSGAIFPKVNPDKPTERHRKVIKDPKFRKHAQTVPDVHKADHTAIQAVSNMSGKKLSEDEIQQICKKYGISRLNAQQSKNLGNTGKVLRFDPNVRGYVLQ